MGFGWPQSFRSDSFLLDDWGLPLHCNEKVSHFSFVLQTFIECLPFSHIHNAAATPAKTQRSKARASESAGVLRKRGCPLAREPKATPASSALGQRAPQGGAAPRTCTRTGTRGSRVSGAGGISAVGAGGGSSRPGGCPRAALVHTLLCFPKPRPRTAHPFSRARAPRAPTRARARACAGQGPPGAAP